VHHAAFAVLVGLMKFAFHLDGGIHQGFKVGKGDVD
jgi:hypothetical protein